MIYTSDSGLVTIAGGKWTTYREMAEETVDEAVKVFGLSDKVRVRFRTIFPRADLFLLVRSTEWQQRRMYN